MQMFVMDDPYYYMFEELRFCCHLRLYSRSFKSRWGKDNKHIFNVNLVYSLNPKGHLS